MSTGVRCEVERCEYHTIEGYCGADEVEIVPVLAGGKMVGLTCVTCSLYEEGE